MDNMTRQAFWNAALVIASMNEGESITREELIDRLRAPLPSIDARPNDASILHAYRHYIQNAGVSQPYDVVTYVEAADLAGKSVQAIRQAAFRGAVMKTTQYWGGRHRTGVYLNSLAEWCRWSGAEFRAAERELGEMRRLNGVAVSSLYPLF